MNGIFGQSGDEKGNIWEFKRDHERKIKVTHGKAPAAMRPCAECFGHTGVGGSFLSWHSL